MADLTEIEASGSVKIAGAVGVGTENNYASVDASNQLLVNGSGVTQPISAVSLPLPTGAATEATLAKLPLSQGSTTSGQSGVLEQGAVTTAAPTYVTGQTSPLSLNTSGGLRVDGSGSTQPVSGTVSATQSGTWTVQPGNTQNTTAWLTQDAANGPVTPGTVATKSELIGGQFNTSLPTLTNTQQSAIQLDSSGRQIVSPLTNSSIVKSQLQDNAGTAITLGQKTMASSVPVVIASDQSNVNVTVSNFPATQNVAVTSSVEVEVKNDTGNPIPVNGTVAATQSGTWTVQPGNTANTTPWLATINQGGNSATVTASNALKVDGSAVTQPVSGTVTANAGTGTFTVGQATASNLNAQVQGPAASGASKSGNPVQVGGVFNTTQPTVTTGQMVESQYTNRGAAIVATGTDNFNINNISGTVSLPTGASTSALQTTGNSSLASIDAGIPNALGAATTANSMPVNIASDQVVPVSATSLPLPTGAATSANQTTEITSLQLIDNPIGTVAAGTAGTNSFLTGGVFNTSLPTLTNGQQVATQLDSSGRSIISPLTNSSIVKAQLQDNAGTGLTSTLVSAKQGLDVNVISSLNTGTVDKATFTYGTSVDQVVGGVFQDTSPSLTAGQSGATRLTANRAFHINIRDASGNEKLGSSTSANSIPVVIASDQGSYSVKLTDGTDTALISANGDQKVSDGLRNGGVYGALNIPTSGTPLEAKVGGARLANRKALIINIENNGVFWGLDNTVTSTTGVPTSNGQVLTFNIDPDSTFQVWLVGSANNKNVHIVEIP